MTEEQVFHGLLMIKLPALCKWVNNDTLNYLQQTVIPAKLCTHAKRWANSWIIAVNSEFLGSQAVFCLATTKESRAEKIHFFPKNVHFYSLHKNNQLFISSSNGGYQAGNKYGHTFVGMVLQIPMISKDFENCWELERSCVPFVCDGRQLAIVEAAELNINRYLCRSILVHGFPLWIWVYRYKQA